jgi:cytochrome oxidase Cu insertion factor (SCO1/SenC/PrrC family)
MRVGKFQRVVFIGFDPYNDSTQIIHHSTAEAKE